jgi:hypothetical protein
MSGGRGYHRLGRKKQNAEVDTCTERPCASHACRRMRKPKREDQSRGLLLELFRELASGTSLRSVGHRGHRIRLSESVHESGSGPAGHRIDNVRRSIPGIKRRRDAARVVGPAVVAKSTNVCWFVLQRSATRYARASRQLEAVSSYVHVVVVPRVRQREEIPLPSSAARGPRDRLFRAKNRLAEVSNASPRSLKICLHVLVLEILG